MSIPGFFVITNAGYISFWGEEDPSRNRADWNEAHALEDALIDGEALGHFDVAGLELVEASDEERAAVARAGYSFRE